MLPASNLFPHLNLFLAKGGCEVTHGNVELGEILECHLVGLLLPSK